MEFAKDPHIWSSGDFMLGDYVYFNGEVVKINALTRSKIGFIGKSGKQRYIRNSEKKVSPIPATPETISHLNSNLEWLISQYQYIHEIQHLENRYRSSFNVKLKKMIWK